MNQSAVPHAQPRLFQPNEGPAPLDEDLPVHVEAALVPAVQELAVGLQGGQAGRPALGEVFVSLSV
jgi:hypothetical protein